MITIKHNRATLQVSPANAEPTRALLALIDKSKGFKGRKFKRASELKRKYPAFYAGMTTAEYLSQYALLNSDLLLKSLTYKHADRAAPMLDASMPEVIEEVDA